MKTLLLILLSLTSLSTFAYKARDYRYATTYREWDRSFTEYHSYSETSYTTTTTCNGYGTCYEGFYDERPVYVEERHVTDTQVIQTTQITKSYTVYRDVGYSDPYVTYYTHNGRVVRRRYHRHSHYHHDYYYSNHYHSTIIYVDFSTVEGKLITGAYSVAVGASVLDGCSSDNELCTILGVAFLAGGVASSISASEQSNKESELQAKIQADSQSEQAGDLDDFNP